MRLPLYISPCPNDTFIFHALIHNLVDTEGLEFEVHFEDIDLLNKRAKNCDGGCPIIKVSCAVLPQIGAKYRLLNCGGALGFGNAPIVVGKRSDIDLRKAIIAIPGLDTTAALLVKKLVNLNVENLRVYLFSDIAQAVLNEEVDAGVLIHEGRFTYPEKGLELVADLGVWWDEEYHLPVPLGAIVVSRELGEDTALRIERVVRRSVEYALANPSASSNFVRCHAVELNEEVRQKHISYFVNRFSVDLGKDGLEAIRILTE